MTQLQWMPMTSPTARTLAHFRKCEIPAGIVERWIPAGKDKDGKVNPFGKRKDLFGFIDVVALWQGIVGIQVTSGSNTAARLGKIQTECNAVAQTWLEMGGRIEIWGWRKLKRRPTEGEFKGCSWVPKIQEVTLTDLYRSSPV